jgi:hypothetical protein
MGNSIHRETRALLDSINTATNPGRRSYVIWVEINENKRPLMACILAFRKLMKIGYWNAASDILDNLESRGDADPLFGRRDCETHVLSRE